VRVSVCIPATRAGTLAAAIASISKQTYTDWELLIVTQGDDKAVAAAARQLTEDCVPGRVLAIPGRGLSRARNAALRHSDGDIVAMMDDDCEAAPGWLAVLVACFDQDPMVGLVGGALVAPTSHGPLARCPALWPADAVYDPTGTAGVPEGWDWIGGNFAIRRWVADRVGEFDECLGAGADFPAGDDTDYKLRLEELGIRMRSTPSAIVHHTFGSRRGLSAVLRLQRGYATGNGALAAKLTLRGDLRGRDWLTRTRRQCLDSLSHPGRLYRAPESLLRWVHYRSAYHRCVRNYEVDERGLLRLSRQDFPIRP
jgi:glycosyltransferase involved in cell wall biosynthesis